jgi:hypothetical protein
VETYWEGLPEPVSPELALVDPVLREKLLSQWPLTDSHDDEPPDHCIDEPLDLPAAPVTASTDGSDAVEGHTRPSHVIAWGSVTTSCATAFAIAILGLSQHPGKTVLPPPAAPAVAVVTAYTPPAAPVDQRSETEKRALAALLRSPMRDPFSHASPGR